jgi:hypothetical protein
VDSLPDPLLRRKSGSAGNRTRDLWICSQELWPLDHRDGHNKEYIWRKYITYYTVAMDPGMRLQFPWVWVYFILVLEAELRLFIDGVWLCGNWEPRWERNGIWSFNEECHTHTSSGLWKPDRRSTSLLASPLPCWTISSEFRLQGRQFIEPIS